MSDQNVVLNGRYELIERVGSGGMAQVYKARDLKLGRIVAIKMLHESLTSDPGFLERFQREAHAAANLSHPNIVTVHDIGQDHHRHYIVMEFVEGQTLKQIIRKHNDEGTTMSINQVLDLTVQVSAGLGYAHRAELVHCDIKPHNVLVTLDDRVKVADFGIARAMSQATQQGELSQIWGTPQYFSPEQAAGGPVDARTDLDGAPFDGARELGALVKGERALGLCLVRQLYRHATGHLESAGEEEGVRYLWQRFTEGHSVKRLALDLVLSEGFRKAGAPE